MAQKTRAQLITDLIANITTNGTGAITGAVLQAMLQDMIDSDKNILTDSIFSPHTMSELFSDFKEDSSDKAGWDAVNVGAGTKFDATTAEIDGNTDGVFELETGTTAGGLSVGAYGNNQTGFVLGGGVRFFEARIQLPDLSAVGEEFIIRIGLGDKVDGSDHEDGVYFEYDRLTNVNWLLKTANSSTRTSTDSGTAVADSVWLTLRAEINAAGTSVEYFIDDVSVGTIITNLPTDRIGENIGIVKSAGTTERKFLIDYYHQVVQYTTPR